MDMAYPYPYDVDRLFVSRHVHDFTSSNQIEVAIPTVQDKNCDDKSTGTLNGELQSVGNRPPSNSNEKLNPLNQPANQKI